MMKSQRIFDDEGMEVGFELVATEIGKISSTIEKLEQTRATRKLILALLHDDTKMNKGTIETILDSIGTLEKKYLKPKTTTKGNQK